MTFIGATTGAVYRTSRNLTGWFDMSLRFLLPLTIALGGALPAAAQDYPPQYGYAQSGYDTDGQSVDSIEVFFDPLSRYGRWIDSRFGRAWGPNVGRDWRPYTIGHWEQGRYGQTWRSDEPFGWAVFHFGRWGFDPAIGWVWTPDTVWGPGWVAWRDSDNVTGWAPLPPRVGLSFSFSVDTGNGGGYNSWGYDQWYQPSWVYVPRGTLYGRSLRGVILPSGRNRDYWQGTRGITRYDRVDGRVVNRSFDVDRGRGDGRRVGGRDNFRRDDRQPDFRRDGGQGGFRRDGGQGETVREGGGRRIEGRRPDGSGDRTPRGTASDEVRSLSTAPRRDFGRPIDGGTSQAAPRDYGRGGFVPFQPQGGARDPGRRGGAPVMVAPSGMPPVIRQEAAPSQPQAQPQVQPQTQQRPEPPRREPPPPRQSPQREAGENNRPQ